MKFSQAFETVKYDVTLVGTKVKLCSFLTELLVILVKLFTAVDEK